MSTFSPALLRQLTFAQAPSFSHPGEILSDLKFIYESVISRFLTPTPLKKSYWLSEITGGDVWLKLDSLNRNGTFKVRGALNAVYQLQQRRPTGASAVNVCAASAGNHAQGVAFAAAALGCEAHIFLPRNSSIMKRDATEKLGAKVYLVGKNLEEAFEAALIFAEENNLVFLHAFNNYDVILGQATCAYESLFQFSEITGLPASELDYFVCSVGGGGLAAGSALALKALGGGEVIGVEQEHFNSALKSMQQKTQVPISAPPHLTIADGIAVGLIGSLNYEYLSRYVREFVCVSDDEIVRAILGLCELEHVVAEGAGAAGVADLLRRPERYRDKKTIVCLSGGNIDPQLFVRALMRGLKITQRVLRLTVCLPDTPGGLKKILECISAMDGNVLDLSHDRTYSSVSVGDVDVEISLETRNLQHQMSIMEKLSELGFKPRSKDLS